MKTINTNLTANLNMNVNSAWMNCNGAIELTKALVTVEKYNKEVDAIHKMVTALDNCEDSKSRADKQAEIDKATANLTASFAVDTINQNMVEKWYKNKPLLEPYDQTMLSILASATGRMYVKNDLKYTAMYEITTAVLKGEKDKKTLEKALSTFLHVVSKGCEKTLFFAPVKFKVRKSDATDFLEMTKGVYRFQNKTGNADRYTLTLKEFRAVLNAYIMHRMQKMDEIATATDKIAIDETLLQD